MTTLLAAAVNGWIADVAFFVILIIGTLIGARLGFIRGVCKAAGWFLSIFFPFMFCVPFAGTLENWFGLESLIAGALGATIGGWLTIAISFVALIFIVRIGTWLLGIIGTALVGSLSFFRVINSLLGAILGLAETFLILMFVLIVVNWLPAGTVHEYIQASSVVSALYHSSLMTTLPAVLHP